MAKERAQCFSPAEQELVIEGYGEFHNLIKTQGNTSGAAKARREGWQKVADKLNAATTGPTRTWEQVKVKYKNILQNANRKKAEQKETGGGPAPPRHTPAEELALGLNAHRASVEGGSSSFDPQPGSKSLFITVLDDTLLPVPVQVKAEACADSEETLSDGGPSEEVLLQEPAPRTADPEGDIRSLSKHSLQHKIEYLELKKQKLRGEIEIQQLIKTKTALEIELLQKELQSKR